MKFFNKSDQVVRRKDPVVVGNIFSWTSPGTSVVKAPGWLMAILGVLCVLFSVLPLVETRLPDAIEILFALLGLYVLFRYGQGLRWSLPVKLMAVSVIVLLISWVFMLLDHPDIARTGPSLEDFLDKFFFLFIALVLAGVERRILVYLGIFGIFIFLMPWLSGGGFRTLEAGLEGQRTGFGINPIRTGVLFGAVFLGLICFSGRWILTPQFSALRLGLWAPVVVFSLVGVVITQSRTAMVAMLPGLVLIFAMFIMLAEFSGRTKAIIVTAITMGVVTLLVISVYTGLSQVVEKRFSQELEVVALIMEGELDDVPRTSWGIRIHFLQEGWHALTERPLTGWGYRAGENVLNTELLRQPDGNVFSQVHNSYLESALRYGLGGLFILLGLFAWALKGTWDCWKKGVVKTDTLIFIVASLSYFMVANLFDALLFQTEGVLLFNVLMGVAASYIFRQRQQTSNSGVSPHEHSPA